VFHFGVLYHLMRPVEHLAALGRMADTIYLDTHIAPRDRADQHAVINGHRYDYALVGEGGWHDPFSGADPTSIHLTYPSLVRALIKAGFANTRLINFREERNGPRILIVASRTIDVAGFPGEADPGI
jgi:tRNA (mo5U34)-methyltransferase